MPDYTTVPKVRAAMGSSVGGEADDVIARLITAVSRQIDRTCNRPDGFAAADIATTRLYAGSGTSVQRIDECAAITLVEVKDSLTDDSFEAWDADDWIAFSGAEDNPDFNRIPYTSLMVSLTGERMWFTSGAYRFPVGFQPGIDVLHTSQPVIPTVRVTARWGYSESVPPDIENAVIIQVARLFKRGGSAFSDALASGDMGALQFRSLAPEVDSILSNGRYIKPRV